jgi:hypothetical protein
MKHFTEFRKFGQVFFTGFFLVRLGRQALNSGTLLEYNNGKFLDKTTVEGLPFWVKGVPSMAKGIPFRE